MLTYTAPFLDPKMITLPDAGQLLNITPLGRHHKQIV